VDGCQEVSGKFVVTSCEPPEVLEAAEASLDDVAPFIGALVEAVEGHPVGFVWNDRLGTTTDDFGAKAVAVVTFVANEGGHWRREFQKGRSCSNICALAWSEMKCVRLTIRVA